VICNISIPFGAIKSFTARSYSFRVNVISIPFGAIKRKRRAGKRKTIAISIPFGAIKSFVISHHRQNSLHFNSFWCD